MDSILEVVLVFVNLVIGVLFLYATVHCLAFAWYSGRLAAIRKAFHLSGRKKKNG